MAEEFKSLFKDYADLVVKVALNIQRGQRLIICNPFGWAVSFQASPLVREIAESAYKAGASFVDVIWGDNELRLMAFRCAPSDAFSRLPAWRIDGISEYFQRSDAVLILLAPDPDLLREQDPTMVSLAGATLARQLAPIWEYRGRAASNCALVAAPTPGWATKVFPGTHPEAAEDKLWRAVFAACHVDQPDSVASWQTHTQQLRQTADYLNRKRYSALRFVSEVTDLSVGLPEMHTWSCAAQVTQQGIHFVGNMPTEEIFTLPHRERVNGIVRSTRPLSYGGVFIEDFTLTLENGEVAKAKATRNQDVLTKLLEVDEGASRLGEVALVPHSSPISRLGIVFHIALYDENAGSHLALGRACKKCLQAGDSMDDDTFSLHGGNVSADHLDFMVGSADMDIDGLTADGAAEPVMRGGKWAFAP